MRNNRRYLIYLLLFLFLCIHSLDRATMGVASSSISAELHIGPVGLGYLFSSYLWLYAVLLLPVGALTDRVGTHRMSAIAAGFWSMSQALGGLATSLTFLLATRLGLGVLADPRAKPAKEQGRERRRQAAAHLRDRPQYDGAADRAAGTQSDGDRAPRRQAEDVNPQE